jgi:hypothetical protein
VLCEVGYGTPFCQRLVFCACSRACSYALPTRCVAHGHGRTLCTGRECWLRLLFVGCLLWALCLALGKSCALQVSLGLLVGVHCWGVAVGRQEPRLTELTSMQ